MTPEEHPPLVTSKTSPMLADIKADWLDPQLRELGLDPDRYELAYEPHEPLPFPAPQPLTDQQELARAAALQTLARGLDIPQEILETPQPPECQREGTCCAACMADYGDCCKHGGKLIPDRVWQMADDPYDVAAFEQTRSLYMPRWRYVSGGKALHAFIDGSDRPACGVDPRRGPDRRPARWIDSTYQGSKRYGDQRRGEHDPCTRAVRAHRDAMLRGGV